MPSSHKYPTTPPFCDGGSAFRPAGLAKGNRDGDLSPGQVITPPNSMARIVLCMEVIVVYIEIYEKLVVEDEDYRYVSCLYFVVCGWTTVFCLVISDVSICCTQRVASAVSQRRDEPLLLHGFRLHFKQLLVFVDLRQEERCPSFVVLSCVLLNARYKLCLPRNSWDPRLFRNSFLCCNHNSSFNSCYATASSCSNFVIPS